MPGPSDASSGIEIIAHRGYSARAPENTLAAVDAAIVAGADAIEFDLHVTRDGVPVLFHDATLDRTTDGSGPLRSKSLDELRSLDAGSWYGGSFAAERVPTLDEALGRLDGRIGRVYPELKGYADPSDLERMAETVLRRGMEDRTVFISMDWEALEQMRACHDSLRIGYIVEKARRADAGLERAAGDPLALLDFRATLLLDDPRLVDRARADDIDLVVWTVDDPAQAHDLLGIGVRRITTNRVTELLAWRASL